MSSHTIALIPGDGVGPEVIAEAKKVLEAVGRVAGIRWEWREFPFGAQHFLDTGAAASDAELDEVAKTEAILFGAVGDSRVPERETQAGCILKMRFRFDQYANLRPCKLYPGVDGPLRDREPRDIDFLVVRENSEDFYIGLGDHFKGDRYLGKLSLKRRLYSADLDMRIEVNPPQEMAFQVGAMTARGAERVARYAFELARKKGLRRVTAVDKANVLTEIYDPWRSSVSKVALDYPEIELEFVLVDALAMFFVRRPEWYQVVLAPNLFGDVLSDLGAGLIGGMGMAPGGNINPEGGPSLFEPIHGSAPDIRGKGIANPVAAILAGKMMLEELGEGMAAQLVDRAVADVLASRQVRTPDLGGHASTSQMGDAIATRVLALGNR